MHCLSMKSQAQECDKNLGGRDWCNRLDWLQYDDDGNYHWLLSIIIKNLGDRCNRLNWIGCNMMMMVIIMGQSCVTSGVIGWFLLGCNCLKFSERLFKLNMIEKKSMEKNYRIWYWQKCFPWEHLLCRKHLLGKAPPFPACSLLLHKPEKLRHCRISLLNYCTIISSLVKPE